ncbi:Mini-ribonuclease 3 [[Clostridium] polysaccharolyticum]|uniref:Mini-ribonuclease 3 n=1 Tax=[Clostridium] polysaccharolyticum TaxID=29364 RepID=A0A1H9YKR5_9FIRM|nr:ribonuclease III domain-containing protein [[Clostridium] polysaccharolyticum]SES69592.1 ribonuclease-3 family protein [[Clostridium] polysaccharolyticum]
MEKSIGLDSVSDLNLADQITKEFFDMMTGKDTAAWKEKMPPSQMSPLTLAFMGDCIFDLVVRTIVVESGNAPVNKLHNRAAHYVKAPSQMVMLNLIKDEFTEEEMAVYKRGRNAKSYTSAKNASIIEYRVATGFEALIGYLYLNRQFGRALYLLHLGIERFDQIEK